MKLKTLSLDIFFLTFLFGISIFLIGYYLNYNFLLTQYQDWIYHAFRIKSIDAYGLTSWDHKWANGINYWHIYQYIPHLIALGLSKILALSFTKAMIVWTVAIFIYLRVATYITARKVGINSLNSLAAVTISYLFSQQWQVIKDFSIFAGLFFLPIFIYLWIIATKNKIYYYLTAALAGFLWSMHPILGLTTSSLLFLDLLLNRKLKIITKGILTLIFMIALASFSVEYLLIPYKYLNPFYETQAFSDLLLTTETFGLGAIYIALVALSWPIFIVKSNKFEYWAKLLMAYVTGFIVLFYLSSVGYKLPLLNTIQFQRANVVIGFISPFLFAYVIQTAFGAWASKFSKFILTALIAVIVVLSVLVSTEWTAFPSNQFPDTVAEYFQSKTAEGSIYYEDESSLSYFSNLDLRLVSSYNEHLLPTPLSLLFKKQLKTNLGYINITESQLDLIQSYMNVLGVEYLVVPHSSPLVEATKEGKADFLVEDGEITTLTAKYTVLRNTRDIHYAYIIDLDKYKEFVGDQNIEDPDLNINSIYPWNDHINKLSKFFDSEDAAPIGLEFIFPNSLSIKAGQTLPGYKNSAIYVNQSYDKNWHTNASDTVISATPLHFMQINSQLKSGQIITLTNTWPAWHWPVEALAPATVLLTAAATAGYSLFSKGKDNKNENK